jgi:tetratricopeptide (TPR) repeat protein
MLRQESVTDEHKEYLRRVLVLTERLTQESGADEATRDAVGKAFARVGKIRQRLHELPEAETAMARAVLIYQQLAAEFPGPRYAASLAINLFDLARIQHALSKGKEAEASYRASLKVREGLLVPGAEPALRHDWATTQEALASVLFLMNRNDEADRAFRLALEAREQLAAAFPDVREHRRLHANTWTDFGFHLAKLGKHLEAEKALRAALTLQEKLELDFPRVRTDARHLEQLGETHYKLGDLLHAARKFAEAERALNKALTIQQVLVAEYPGVPNYRRQLCRSHNELGVVLMEDPRRSKEAESNLVTAVKLIERLLADRPDGGITMVALGGSCCNLGLVLRDRGDLKTSLTWYQRAVDALEPVYQKESQPGPRRDQAQRFLHNSHSGRAGTLSRLGRHQEALPSWERAVALADDRTRDRVRLQRAITLARLHQTDRAAAEADHLARARGASGQMLYDVARVYALCAAGPSSTSERNEAFAVRAVELLRRAAAAGFVWFDNDADFTALRGRGDFRKLRP